MDRHLLIGAILILLLEVSVLLGDLGLLPGVHLFQTQDTPLTTPIGQVQIATNNVRRRHQSSVLWENSDHNMTLFSYDSVLTLKNSTARLTLKGDTQLRLHENTLVVLEPLDPDHPGHLRLRLGHGGLRSNNPSSPFKMGAGPWLLNASPGSDLGLRQLSDGQLELEVVRGQVQLANEESDIQESISSGQKLKLSSTDIREKKTLSQELQWNHPDLIRIYSHELPAEVAVQWEGQPDHLEIVDPEQNTRRVPLAEDQSSWSDWLRPGTYFLTLNRKNLSSRSLTLNVWPAPVIYYNFPLPRDRVPVNQSQPFSWLPLGQGYTYQIEIRSLAQTDSPVQQIQSGPPHKKLKFDTPAALNWQVHAFDQEGFQIPARFEYPIYSVKNPLKAPKLKAPAMPLMDQQHRKPAESKEDSRTKKPPSSQKTSWLKWLFAQWIPSAEARIQAPKKPVTFEWYAVEEADYYIIEISRSPDFQNPEIINKVRGIRFSWNDYDSTIYHYRVAAGQDNGTMGLFSAPQTLDLRFVNQSPTPKKKPIVKQALAAKNQSTPQAKSKVEPATANDLNPLGSPPPSSNNQNQRPTRDSTQKDKSQVTKGPLPLLKADTSFTYAFSWSPHYAHTRMEAEQLDVDRIGWTPASMSFFMNAPLYEKGSLQLHLDLRQVKWKRHSGSGSQSDLTESKAHGLILYRPPRQLWSIGLALDHFSFIERASNQAVLLKSVDAAGVAARVSHTVNIDYKLNHLLSASHGDDLWVLRNANEFLLTWKTPHRITIQSGPNVGFRWITGPTQQSANEAELGWTLKMNW